MPLQQEVLFSANAAAIAISATSTASTAVAIPGMGSTIRVTNEGPNVAFLAVSQASGVLATLPSGTANTTSTPVLSGQTAVLSVPVPAPGSVNYISAICRATQTAVLTVQDGEGHQ